MIALVLFIFYVQTAGDHRDPDIVGAFAFDTVAECEASAPKLAQRLMADDTTVLGIAHECRAVAPPSGI